MIAKKLEDIYAKFQNVPISTEEFEELYVDADAGRGKTVYSRLKRRLLGNVGEGIRLKMLLAGHKGCGKSTELIRLQREIESRFLVFNFSVLKELDILNLNYIELFIVAMEKLFRFVKNEHRIKLDPELLKNIQAWVGSKELLEISERYLGMNLETEVQAGIDAPFLAKFFAKFKAAAKTSTSLKEALKTKVEPRLSELIFNANLLISNIRDGLPAIKKDDLVIIVEDLDKLQPDKAQDIFYYHSAPLTELKCHFIFTFPIALRYHIRFKTIQVNYNDAYVLPMIKVAEKDGAPFKAGMDVMKRIVGARMDLSLFNDKKILDDMIKLSGGCLWDLFRIIREASDNALDNAQGQIRYDDFHSAYRTLKADYEATIAEDSAKKISAEDYYEALKECAENDIKKPNATDIILDLRNNMTLLNYNGDDWSDVHPVVKEILKEKGYLKSGIV